MGQISDFAVFCIENPYAFQIKLVASVEVKAYRSIVFIVNNGVDAREFLRKNVAFAAYRQGIKFDEI